MTTSTGEDRGLDPAATDRGAIPADTYAHRLMLVRAHAGEAEGLGRSLSIREAADRTGLSYNTWANWERGIRSRTSMEDTTIISETFGVDREWLRDGGPLTRVPPTQRDRRRDRHGRNSHTGQYVSALGILKPATRSDVRAPRDGRPITRSGSAVRVITGRKAA